MGWFGFGGGEKSDGDTGKVSDVRVDVKTDSGGRVTDVMVNESKSNPHHNHTHYYEKSNGSWGSKSKGRG